MSSEPWVKFKWKVYRVDNAVGLEKCLNDCEKREEEIFQVLEHSQELCIVARQRLGEH